MDKDHPYYWTTQKHLKIKCSKIGLSIDRPTTAQYEQFFRELGYDFKVAVCMDWENISIYGTDSQLVHFKLKHM